MIDKDILFLNVLKRKLPNTNILLCKFYVMKYFKKKVSDLVANIKNDKNMESIYKS